MIATMPAQEVKRLCHEAFVDGVLESEAEYRAGLSTPTTVAELMTAFDD